MGLNLNLTFPLQSTSSACTSNIAVRTTLSGESPRLETWEKFQAGRLLHLLQGMLLSRGFLITSALQASSKGPYPIRSLLNHHNHFLIGDTHYSTSLSSSMMDFHNTNLLMSLMSLFKASERVRLHWYSPRSLPDLESLPHLFLVFQYLPHLFSFFLESYRHLKVLKVSPKYDRCSVPNFKAHIVPTLLSLPRCSQLKLLFHTPSVLYCEFYHIYSSVSLPQCIQNLPEEKNQVIFIFVFCLLHLPTIIC